MPGKSEGLWTLGYALIGVALLGLIGLVTYLLFRSNDQALSQFRFETVLVSDASFMSSRRSKHSEVVVCFISDGNKVTGIVWNYNFIEPSATRDMLMTLRSGDTVVLTASELPSASNDVVDLASISRRGLAILTPEQSVLARRASDRRMLLMLLVTLSTGAIVVVGLRFYSGSWHKPV